MKQQTATTNPTYSKVGASGGLSLRDSVALATCAEVPFLDEEGPPLSRALRSLGIRTEPVVWDDPEVRWECYDLVLIRSTWDYPLKHARFLKWAQEVAAVVPIANELEVLCWNTDKRYLEDLAYAGLPVVPTTFVEPKKKAKLPKTEFVVKPTVSAGTKDSARYGPGEAGRALEHLKALHATDRSAMIQPYVSSVDTLGETALVYLDGSFSHAVRKGPLLWRGREMVEGLFAEETIEPLRPSPEERAVADATLNTVTGWFGPLLYARVDLVYSEQGSPALLELELTEPSLFLHHDEQAAFRLATGIRRLLEERASERG